MFDKFGEMDSYKEINELAENLFNEGDIDSLRVMAKENGIPDDFVEMYLEGAIPELCDSTTAALGKLDVEAARLKLNGLMLDWVEYIKGLCMEEVMKAAGSDMAVLVKMNMRDGFKGGMELDETLEVARTLQNECGAHALILSGGFVSRAPMYVMRGSMPIHTMTHYMPFGWLPLGVKMAGRFMIPSEPFKEAYFLEDALKFRAALKMPLVYVGGLISREKIDEVLNDGFEFVSMARALLNDPSFVNKMKEDEHARCDCGHSNYCIARMYSIEMACHKHIQNLPKSIVKEIEKLEYK